MIHVQKKILKKKKKTPRGKDPLNTDIGNKSSAAHHCEVPPELKEWKRRDFEAF